MDSKQSSKPSTEAFNEFVEAIAKDMPLVMHGSGDVQPNEVYPESASVLSELTAIYIENLVSAAVDAHEILNDGPQPLPLPPLPRSRTIPKPSPPEPKLGKGDNSNNNNNNTANSNSNNNSKKEQNRKRRRVTDEFWDEPMEAPKIKNKPTPQTPTPGPKYEGVHVDEWVGAAGVDFFDTQRSRKAYVRAPFAIGTPSFIFPVCHDVGLYGKVLEVQQARRSIAPVLADPAVQDVVRNEGSLQAIGALRKRTKKVGASEEDIEEPEETDSDGEDGAAWPGLDNLLPVYMNGNFSADS